MGRKLTQEKADSIRQRIAAGESREKLAQEYLVDRGTISRIEHHRVWVSKPPFPHVRLFERTIELRNGGTIELVVQANIYELTPQEGRFLRKLVDLLDVYEGIK